jgi:menaquinone-dependent protoporphyrinogen oxidase
MAKILLLYSSVYGLSRRICERLQASLVARGEQADVAALVDKDLNPAAYDTLVIGASIRQGKHNPTVADFVRTHLGVLQTKPSAFFSVNLVARKPGKNTAQTNPYVQRFLANCPWQPQLLGVFAGELDYQRYGPLERRMVQLVMWINKGPTAPKTRVTFTDWDEVDRFAGKVAALAAGRSASA